MHHMGEGEKNLRPEGNGTMAAGLQWPRTGNALSAEARRCGRLPAAGSTRASRRRATAASEALSAGGTKRARDDRRRGHSRQGGGRGVGGGRPRDPGGEPEANDRGFESRRRDDGGRRTRRGLRGSVTEAREAVGDAATESHNQWMKPQRPRPRQA
jgi:hypothetical protein